jgi:hypothetical protein
MIWKIGYNLNKKDLQKKLKTSDNATMKTENP